jgi:C-terminal repeat of topoisomerase
MGQILHRSQVTKLLASKRTDLLTEFISKAGKKFSAFLVLGDDAKITFEFPARESVTEAVPVGHIPSKTLRERGDCKLLISIATKDLFRNNAFRITGLAVDSTTRDITKHADKLKMMAQLGQGQSANLAAFALNPPPGSDEIREAIQRLKDPERRIIDEFFWFWPSEFGRSSSDPAIQALAEGDSQAALHQWQSFQTSGPHGVIARHNLAVYWHLMALEWEHKLLDGGVDDGTLRDMRSYWKQTFQYWDSLLHQDDLWDMLASRIRQLDDPRLTSGFARKIRATLPQAFDKINAELAISYVHAKKHELARFHVDFMRQTNQGLDDIENTAELVLSPARKQLRQHIIVAKRTADEDPARANEAARALLRCAQPLLQIFDLLYGKGNMTRDDAFDEVAAVGLNCAISHRRETSDDKAFVALLCDILLLPASEDLRLQIKKYITTGRGNIAYAHLQPLLDILNEITKSNEAIRVKYLRIRNEVLTRIKSFEPGDPAAQEAQERCFLDLAWAFRTLSIDAHNDDADSEMALEIIELARQCAKHPDIQKKIAEDIKQLTQIKQNQDSHNLLLTIRDDLIEINAKKVRYNPTVIPTNEISGIKFGILRHYTNGIKTSVSYIIGLASTDGDGIDIECKRFFRSESQAEQDFNAILSSLFYHVVPELCTRIARNIKAGRPQQIGDSLLTSEGIRATVGMLMWKEEVLVSWSDVRFGIHQGRLNISSAQNRKFSKSYSLRDIWNAVIFEQIVNTLIKIR